MKITLQKRFLKTLATALVLPAALATATLADTGDTAPAPGPAPAADAAAPEAAKTAAPAPAAVKTDAATATDEEKVLLEAVTVSELGISRANATLRPADISPTTSTGTDPVLTLNRLPGISVNSVDPIGVRVSSGSSLRLRAYGLSALAVAADGIPVPGAGGLSSNSINHYIEAENIDHIEVSPGTADVTTSAYTALGGSINFYSKPPAEHPGIITSGTYGTNNLYRLYARVDTGKYKGFSAFASGSESHVDEVFANKGGHDRKKYDAQLRWENETGNLVIYGAYSYFKADDLDTRSISGSYKQYLGKNQKELAALGVLGNLSDGGRHWFYSTVLDGDPNGLDSIYWDKNRNGRVTQLGSVHIEYHPTDDIKVTAIPYYQDRTGYNRGAVPFNTALQFFADNQYATKLRTGSYRRDIVAPDTHGTVIDDAWLDGYVAAVANGTSAAYRRAVTDGTDQARQGFASGNRYGVPVTFSWNIGSHKLEAGLWLERDAPDYVRYGYNQVKGSNANRFDYSRYWVSYYDNHYDARTFEFHLKDTAKFFDNRLTLSAGFRSVYQKLNYSGQPDILSYYEGITYNKSFTFDDWFQPQAGATWALTAHDELFVNLSRNFSAISGDTVSSTSFLTGESKIKPEHSINLDFGVRTVRQDWSASLSAYVMQYEDRIGSVTPYDPLGFGSASTRTNYANLGNVFGYGAELLAAWTPLTDLNLGFSGTWQRLEYDDNYAEPDGRGGKVVRKIKGKTVPNTPEWVANFNASYFFGAWFVGANARFVDGTYLNTANTQSIGSSFLVGLGFGYDGIARPAKARFPNIRVAVTVNNLFDRHWFYASSGSSYSNGSFSVGAPRTILLTVTAKF